MLLVTAYPVIAQPVNSDIATLRAELDQARKTVEQLSARLAKIEAKPAAATTAISSPAIAGATDTAVPATIAVVDLSSIPIGDNGPRWTLVPDAPLDRAQQGGATGRRAAFELTAGTGGGRASFLLTQGTDRQDLYSKRGDQVVAVNDVTSLTLSAPVAKSGDTSLATLDGLASGSKLEFSFSRFRGVIPTKQAMDQNPLLMRARARCNAAVPAYKQGCVRVDGTFGTDWFTPTERMRYEREFAEKTIQKSRALSAHAALGYDEFGFYDMTSLAKAQAKRLSWSAGAAYTLFPTNSASLTFDGSYQHAFEAQKSRTVCPVTAIPANVICIAGAFGTPNQVDKVLISAEYRQIVDLGDKGLLKSIGFGPRIEYDANSDELAVDVPVYLVPDAKGGLTGGVRFGYLSKGDAFIAGLFIGSTFNLFPK